MSQLKTTPPKPDATALNGALEALKTYDQGSGRAALLPIDEAVVACLNDKLARKELEGRLATALTSGSVAAREYLCSKLALIGTEHCVPALAALLKTPELSTAARTALEAMPSRQATKALRDSLPKVEGLQKVGVINSLGARRAPNSVRALAALIKSNDAAMAGAAAAALGDIANSKAAKTLRESLPSVPEKIRSSVTDAILTCAERLLADGERADAQTLYRLLATTTQRKHVQYAAARGLELTARKK
jgi:HEAT repeat protein